MTSLPSREQHKCALVLSSNSILWCSNTCSLAQLHTLCSQAVAAGGASLVAFPRDEPVQVLYVNAGHFQIYVKTGAREQAEILSTC